jgi:transcriptional regulator with XRE-family HTH domain
MTNLERIMKELSPARRKKVEARAAQLIAEEMTLQELRRARKLTKVRMAKKLGVSQDGISKLEKRSDLLLSTLRKTVEAMGGSLSLVGNFPTAILSCCAVSLKTSRPRDLTDAACSRPRIAQGNKLLKGLKALKVAKA